MAPIHSEASSTEHPQWVRAAAKKAANEALRRWTNLPAQTPMNLKVPPNGTSVFNISVWGRSRGGYLRTTEPVSIRGTAYLRGASGSFVRIFTENLSQMG